MSHITKNIIITTSILFLGISVFASCATTKEVGKESISVTSTHHLTVSFFSPGGGINEKAKAVYDTFLKENYSELKFDEIRWGREGEVDYCFQNIALSEDKTTLFIQETKELMAKFDKVNITENEPCREGRIK